jgi:peptide deformylase
MKRYLVIVSVIVVIVFACKKEKESPDPQNITPTVDLSWTQSERDSILFGDTATAMRIFKTTWLPDSLVLRKQSIDVVPDTNDVVLMTLVRRMLKAMIASGGVGIAAPQVGINRNIFWVKRQDKIGRPNEVYLNLKIVMTSSIIVNFNGDGCLSIPGISGKTQRWRAVGIEYDKLDGSHVSEVVDGYTSTQFTAICFQHEYDHLKGILFVDRIVP